MMRWVSHAQALTDPAAAELNHQHLEFVFKQTWESNYQILAKMDKHSGWKLKDVESLPVYKL